MSAPLTVANNYLPPFQKCIFGFTDIGISVAGTNAQAYTDLYFNGSRTSFITEVAFTNLTYTQFKVVGLCLGTCPLGYYIDPQSLTYQCINCFVPNCSIC